MLEHLRPKNFQVREMFREENNELIPVDHLKPGETGQIEYYFGGKTYKHVGEWPIVNATPKYIIPLKFAFFFDNDKCIECTDVVRKYYNGPTQSRPNIDVYAPRPHFRISFHGGFKFSIGIKWVLVKKNTGAIHTLNILNQADLI
jgi:hypothetical protein